MSLKHPLHALMMLMLSVLFNLQNNYCVSHPSRCLCVRIKAGRYQFFTVNHSLFMLSHPSSCGQGVNSHQKTFRISLAVTVCCHTLEPHSEAS